MKEYFKQLDGVRFIAVFAVLFAHYVQYQYGNFIALNFPFVYGVTLFFVLSGFLITRILLQQKNLPIWRNLKVFYTRRFFRIFPVYYVVLVVLFLLDFEDIRSIWAWLFTYTINIFEAINNTVDVGHFNHFWSLALEEQFYLFWPLIVFLIPLKRFVPITLILIMASIGYKFYLLLYTGNWVENDVSLFSNFNSLGLGALLAYFSIYSNRIFEIIGGNMVLVFTGITAIILFVLRIYFVDNMVIKIILMPFFWILFFGSFIARATVGFNGPIGSILSNKVVVYLGRISYGIYIIHQFIPPLFEYLMPHPIFFQNKYIGFIGFSLVTVIIASFSWYVLEKPINKLKNRFSY
tara:strand:- start:103632 stop:104681 length:1050 start_codon:yes stop_codon:yes gene_type:complete